MEAKTPPNGKRKGHTTMNTSFFIGRLTKDPEIQFLQTGTAIANFSVAIQDNYKKKDSQEWVDRAHFVDCKAWSKAAERINEKFHKGQMVAVEAKITQESWEDSTSKQKRSKIVFEVKHIEDIERYGRRAAAKESGGDQNAYQKPQAPAQTQRPTDVPADFDEFEDDIPF